jgi:hypothetical protein
MFERVGRRAAAMGFAIAGVLACVAPASAGIGATEQVSVSPAAANISGRLQDMTPDGKFALFTSTDGGLYLRDLVAQTTVQVPVDGGPARNGRLSDDGNLILFSWTASGRIGFAVRDMLAATTTPLNGPSGGPISLSEMHGMDISGDGSRIAIQPRTGGILLMKTDTQAIRRGDALVDPELSKDGRLVVGENGTVCHADTDPVTCTALPGGPSITASLSAAGRFMVFSRTDRTIQLLDRTTSAVTDIPALPGIDGRLWTSLQPGGLKISPNGQWVSYAARFPDASRSGGVRTDGFLFDRNSKLTQRVTIGSPDMWGIVTPILTVDGASALFTAQLGTGTPTDKVAEKHTFDRTGPATPSAPTVGLQQGGTLDGGTAPVEVLWNRPADAFMAQARQSTVSGTAAVLNPLTIAESQVFRHHVDDTLAYRLRLADAELDTTNLKLSPAAVVQLRLREETAGTYDGTWYVGTSTKYSGHRDKWSDSPTSTVSFSFNGMAVAWVASTGADRGIARVSIDGADQGTVDLSSSTLQVRKLVFAKRLAPGPHTMTVTVLQSPGGDRVDVDGIVFLAGS